MKREDDANFDFLGAPVGSEEFCKAYLREKRLDPSRARLSALKDLEDAHAAYKILSSCLGSCKVMYAMRTTRSDWATEVCGEYDALVREVAESLLGVSLPDTTWKHACLSAVGVAWGSVPPETTPRLLSSLALRVPGRFA